MTTSDSSQATSQTSSQPAVSDQGAPAAVAPAPAAAVPGPAAAAPAKVETPPATAAPAVTAPEPKPAEATADPAKPAEPTKAVAAPVIPETYTLPEIKDGNGKAIALNPELLSTMAPAFKATGLNQDAVNGLVKTFIDYQTTALPKQMLARDLEVTMKDPELGGMNWGKTQGAVNEALGAFTTPEFRQKLERWGIANDLEFVRVFASIGRAMRGDVAVRGSPSTVSDESMADRMYRKAVKPNIQ